MKERHVVVTGAAGSLGRATTATLAEAGWSVIGVDHAEMTKDASFAWVVGGVDLTNPEITQSVFADIHSRIPALQALVNIAGGFVWEGIESGKAATWSHMYQMNVGTTLNACKAALPLLLAEGGAIVNVGAAAALKADSGMGAYAASKAGVMRLSESLAAELKDRGVRVNAVLPSIIDTPPNRRDMPTADFAKWVSPDALADVIQFLISEQSRAITGALIPVTART